MSGFKLNFESQFDILHAKFCFNFSLYWCCSWHAKKKKGNYQDLTKYLINDCSSFWIMRVSLWSTNCVVPCAECTLPPPPPPKKKYTLPHLPPPIPRKKGQASLCICRRFSVYILRIHILLMQTHKILTAGIGRLIRIFFISNRSDVCFIIKALPGVLKSWGERPFIFRAGPHYPHGPYFYCAEKPRSDDEISVVC